MMLFWEREKAEVHKAPEVWALSGYPVSSVTCYWSDQFTRSAQIQGVWKWTLPVDGESYSVHFKGYGWRETINWRHQLSESTMQGDVSEALCVGKGEITGTSDRGTGRPLWGGDINAQSWSLKLRVLQRHRKELLLNGSCDKRYEPHCTMSISCTQTYWTDIF